MGAIVTKLGWASDVSGRLEATEVRQETDTKFHTDQHCG